VLPTVLFLLASTTSFPERAIAAVARPSAGTVKVYITKFQTPGLTNGASVPVDSNLLAAAGAAVIDDEQNYLVISVPSANIGVLQRGLAGQVQGFEVRNDFDVLDFKTSPIDVRQPVPTYPLGWARSVPLPDPSRDLFVIQFASTPLQEWLDQLRAAGLVVIDYIPQNGYTVLGSLAAIESALQALPIQYFALHQPMNKVSDEVRQQGEEFVDISVAVLAAPEAGDVENLLAAEAVYGVVRGDEAGDRRILRATVSSGTLPQLAAFPAVIWIEVHHPITLSGEREAHLVAGDTLVTNSGSPAVLKPALGDYRSWITSKGLSNYKTAVKVAILDTGFDQDNAPTAFKDFRNDANQPFVTVKNYTSNNQSGANSDCYGHGTMVAGVLAGNAGGPSSTQTKDNGSQHSDNDYFMGLGVAPSVPLISGRIINYLASAPCNGSNCFFPQPWTTIYADLLAKGVSISSNSFNLYPDTSYSVDSQTFDKIVRHANGIDTGSPMTVYFSAGNQQSTGPTQPPNVMAPATGKNVTTVGGTENFNPNTYPDPNPNIISPTATKGIYADNGNDIWSLSCYGPTTDGRIKPDLVAPASAIESPRTRDTDACKSSIPIASVGAVIDTSSPADQQHLWSQGTSFASPAAAGAGVLLSTWYRNTHSGTAPSPAMLKAMQTNLALDLYPGGRSPSPTVIHPPDLFQGWGKTDLTRAFKTDGRYLWNDQVAANILTPSKPLVFLPSVLGKYQIKDSTKPVRVTLVWSDAPGSTAGGTALVNDLNLIVNAGGVAVFCLGNDNNLSTGRCNVHASGGTYDHKNNVEQVVFTQQDLGVTFNIEIFGSTIAADGINAWSGTTLRQDFALFIENAYQP
jgi:hypothetical protein